MTEVLIRHKTTGVEYAVQVADFRRGKHSVLEDGTPATYEDAGFEIVHQHPSGLPYEAPRASSPSRSESAAEKKD